MPGGGPLRAFRLLHLREIRRRPLAYVAIALVVAAASATVTSVSAVGAAVVGSVKSTVDIGGRSAVVVTSPTTAGLDYGLVARVAAVTGVEAAVPIVTRHVAVGRYDSVLLGVDARAEVLGGQLGARIHHEVTESARNPSDYLTGVFLGTNLARAAGVGSGASVNVTSAASRRLRVLDIIGAGESPINDGYFAVVLLPVAQDLEGRPQRVDAIYVTANPGTDIVGLEARVAALVAGVGQVTSPALELARAVGSIGSLQTLLDTLAGLVVGASALLTFEVLTLLGLLRRPELAVGRLLGRPRGAIVWGFLGEVGLVAVGGASLGALAGLGLSPVVVARIPAAYSAAVGSRIAYAPPLSGAVLGVAVATLGALLATVGAARAAGRIAPLEAVEPGDAGVGDDRQGSAAMVAVGILMLVGGGGMDAGMSRSAIPPGTITVMLLGGLAAATWGARGAVAIALAWPLQLIGVAGRLAATALRGSPRRAWGLTMLVASATAVLVGVGGVGQGVSTTLGKSVEDHRRLGLVVQTAPATGLPTTLTMPSNWESSIAVMPGVRGVVADRLRFADYGGPRFLTLGIGAGSHDPALGTADETTREAVVRGRGALVNQGFAESHHVRRGDVIRLGGPVGEALPILGVVRFPSIVAGGEVVISNAVFQRAYGAGDPNRYEVVLRPGSAPSVHQRIDQLAAAGHVPTTVLTGDQLADAEVGLAAPLVALFMVLSWIVGLGTSIGLGASLVLSTTLRRREIAMVRVIGSTRRQVTGMLALEALAPTALGLLLGAAAGFGVFIAAAADSERFFGIPLPPSFPFEVGLLVVMAGLGASMLLAVGTALRAASGEPAMALVAD